MVIKTDKRLYAQEKITVSTMNIKEMWTRGTLKDQYTHYQGVPKLDSKDVYNNRIENNIIHHINRTQEEEPHKRPFRCQKSLIHYLFQT